MRSGSLMRIRAAGFLLVLVLPISLYGATVRLRVTAEIANLREKPDIGSAIVRQVPRGTILLSTAKEGDWYFATLVTESGRSETGFVHESLVAVVTPGEEQEQPSRTPETVATRPAATPPEKPARRPAPVASQSRGTMLSLVLSAGGNMVLGGDLNRGAEGLSGYFRDSLKAETDDEVAPVQLGFVAGGEALFPLANNVSLGLGADYLRSSRQSQVLFKKDSTSSTYTAKPAVWAIPLRAFLAFSPLPFLQMKIGVEYWLAHASYYYRWEGGQDWQEWTGEADAQGLGVFGGLGLEWRVTANFSLVLELAGRYAPLTGFTGTGLYSDSDDITAEEEGKLYYYETRISGGSLYTLLFIRERAPSEGGVYNPRPAEVDFTGAALRAGLKLSF